MARRTHNRRHSRANMATTAERAARRAAERGGGGEDQDEREEDGRSGKNSVPVFFNTNALPRITIGADVWGESDIMTGVY